MSLTPDQLQRIAHLARYAADHPTFKLDKAIAAILAPILVYLLARVGFNADPTFTAALTVACALLIVRRQALRSAEPFWTSPTKRVVSAMLPPLVAGFCLSLVSTLEPDVSINAGLPATWALLYGAALHSAGFFISRGVRSLGWLFVLAGCAVTYADMRWMPEDWADDGRVPNAEIGRAHV